MRYLKPNLCSVNVQLTEKVSPIKFNKKDFVTYHCALINTKKKHGVPKTAEDRFFIKETGLKNILKLVAKILEDKID